MNSPEILVNKVFVRKPTHLEANRILEAQSGHQDREIICYKNAETFQEITVNTPYELIGHGKRDALELMVSDMLAADVVEVRTKTPNPRA